MFFAMEESEGAIKRILKEHGLTRSKKKNIIAGMILGQRRQNTRH